MAQDRTLYVNNDELMQALLASHMNGGLTYECMDLFGKIVKQRVHKFLVYNRNEHEEAMEDMCMQKLQRIWHAFKFQNNNPFAYFVSIIDNVIKQYFIRNQLQFTSIDEQNERYNEK